MRKLLTCFLCISFLNTTVFADQPLKAFILKGKISNFKVNKLLLTIRKQIIDTIAVDSNGKFYLNCNKIKEPALATLGYSEIATNLYVAPGYDIAITGDALNPSLFVQTKKITGIGSESNRFIFLLDSIFQTASIYKSEWYKLNEPDLLEFVKEDQRLRDSCYRIVFNKKPKQDMWLTYFSELTKLDNLFWKFYYVISHAIDNQAFTHEEMLSFTSRNLNKNILSDLYNPYYLKSNIYRQLMLNDYFLFLKQLKSRKDSSYRNDKEYQVQNLEQIANHYKGEIKQIALKSRLINTITYCRSFEELNMYKEKLPEFIALLKNRTDRDSVERLIANTEKVLEQKQIGKPAPVFVVEDSTGLKFSLNDYKGKVIYLDLWASWCIPCRQETPYLKEIVDKFKGEEQIQFLSVAVMDKIKEWKEAMIKDKPTWQQFFDKNGDVQRRYVANSIPKFILIDKKGNIVNFDAPPPSKAYELEILLRQEIAK